MTPSQAQHRNPEQYGKNARFVSDLGMPVVDLLSPQSGERILDLGCGDGTPSLKLVDLGGRVVGVDSSAEITRATHSLGLDAHVVDGQNLPCDNEFDVVFSPTVAPVVQWSANFGQRILSDGPRVTPKAARDSWSWK